MMVIPTGAMLWWHWLVLSETEVAAAATTTATIASRCHAAEQEQSLK